MGGGDGDAGLHGRCGGSDGGGNDDGDGKKATMGQSGGCVGGKQRTW